MSDLSPYSDPKPPVTITQVKDDKFLDFTCLHTWIMLGTIGLILRIFSLLPMSSPFFQGAGAALIIVIIAVWIKYFSTFDKVEKRKSKFLFYIAELRGQHVMNMLDLPLTFLEKIVPIVHIYNDGIIQFTNNQFGTLVETNPARISDEERPMHEKMIEKVINGIPTNTYFKTIACSRIEPKKSILKYMLDEINKTRTDKAADIHLLGIYNKIASDNSNVISWKYYVFIGLGEWKTVDEARIQYGAIMPGLLKNMRVAKLKPRVLIDSNEISNAYRTLFSEMVI